MQFSLFAAVIVLFSAVSADRTIKVLYNNGVSSSTSGSCTENDLIKTQAILAASGLNSTYGKRQLRAVMEDTHDMTDSMMLSMDESHRVLWPRQCKNACAGVTSGCCQEVGCKGYRRHRNMGETQDDRGLLSGAAFTCTQQVNYINTELNKLVSQNNVTSSCKTLLSKPRNITCYDDVIYGVVEYFKLWDTDASPQKVLIDDFTGQDIGKGHYLTFEAITNDCVDSLYSTLTGPNGYFKENHEYIRPFSVFGDSVPTDGKLWGSKLPYHGQYTLTALPDGLMEKKKVVTFNVVPGTVTAVKLWDTTAKTVLNANFTGGNVCNTKFVNFEPIFLPKPDSVKFSLTSTNGFSQTTTEKSAPYSVMGDNNGVFHGTQLQNGYYTLTIYPDEIVSSMVKTIQFNAVTC